MSEVSTSVQLSAGVKEAAKRRAVHIEAYEDLGVSAFNGDERPDFERLLHDCRMGRINLVVVYYVSRFSRMNPLDAIPIVTELLNLGVTIVSVTEGEFRRGNQMDLIHLILRLDSAYSESQNKSVAVKSAKALAKSLGGWSGPAPYGLETYDETVTVTGGDSRTRTVVVKKLRPSPVEAQVIRERIWGPIKQYKGTPYEPGYSRFHPGSVSGVTTTLNRDDVPTRGRTTGKGRKASQWERKTVHRILIDPRLAGYAAEPIFREAKNGKRAKSVIGYRILRDNEGEPLKLCDPVIPPNEWWELQAWLKTRGRGKGLSRGISLLVGMEILYCACGKPMGSTKYPNGKRAYRCTRGQGVTAVHDGVVVVSMNALDDYVASMVYGMIQAPEADEDALMVMGEVGRRFRRSQEAPSLTGERATLLGERAEAVGGLEELYDERDAGGFRSEIGSRRFREAEAVLERRLEGADRRLAALEADAFPTLDLAQWLPASPGADALGEGSWWERAHMEERREFLKLLVRRIEVQPLERKRVAEPMEQRVRMDFHRPTAETGA